MPEFYALPVDQAERRITEGVDLAAIKMQERQSDPVVLEEALQVEFEGQVFQHPIAAAEAMVNPADAVGRSTAMANCPVDSAGTGVDSTARQPRHDS